MSTRTSIYQNAVEEQNAALKADVKTLSEKNAALRQNAALKVEVKTLSDTNAALRRKNIGLQMTKESLEAALANNVTRINALEQMNTELCTQVLEFETAR